MRFGPSQPIELAPMNLLPLSECSDENWLAAGPATPVQQGAFSGHQTDQFAWLQACVEVTNLASMRNQAASLYAQLLAAITAIGRPRLVRIWNYIPDINRGEGDNEVYRQFCWGRADNLTDTVLPAATGIGSHDGWLRVGALCTLPADATLAPTLAHLENPRQLSAWRYPRAYGPRSPSFARATLIQESPSAGAPGLLLLSGTASIVDHHSLHEGDLARQTGETAANIHALLATLPRPAEPLAMRYYLRDAEQQPAAMAHWIKYFPGWAAPAFYKADICRSNLDMEVEGVFSV